MTLKRLTLFINLLLLGLSLVLAAIWVRSHWRSDLVMRARRGGMYCCLVSSDGQVALALHLNAPVDEYWTTHKNSGRLNFSFSLTQPRHLTGADGARWEEFVGRSGMFATTQPVENALFYPVSPQLNLHANALLVAACLVVPPALMLLARLRARRKRS